MTEPKSPLDVLLARISQLLEGTAGADVADQVHKAVRDFLAAFRLVPKAEFEEHLGELQDLQAEVEELSRRIRALELQED